MKKKVKSPYNPLNGNTDKVSHITIPCDNDECVELINKVREIIEEMGQIICYSPDWSRTDGMLVFHLDEPFEGKELDKFLEEIKKYSKKVHIGRDSRDDTNFLMFPSDLYKVSGGRVVG
jgi:hypothetical protein